MLVDHESYVIHASGYPCHPHNMAAAREGGSQSEEEMDRRGRGAPRYPPLQPSPLKRQRIAAAVAARGRGRGRGGGAAPRKPSMPPEVLARFQNFQGVVDVEGMPRDDGGGRSERIRPLGAASFVSPLASVAPMVPRASTETRRIGVYMPIASTGYDPNKQHALVIRYGSEGGMEVEEDDGARANVGEAKAEWACFKDGSGEVGWQEWLDQQVAMKLAMAARERKIREIQTGARGDVVDADQEVKRLSCDEQMAFIGEVSVTDLAQARTIRQEMWVSGDAFHLLNQHRSRMYHAQRDETTENAISRKKALTGTEASALFGANPFELKRALKDLGRDKDARVVTRSEWERGLARGVEPREMVTLDELQEHLIGSKLGEYAPPEQTAAMARGNIEEGPAAYIFEQVTGIELLRGKHPKYGDLENLGFTTKDTEVDGHTIRVGATPDRMGRWVRLLVEIKSRGWIKYTVDISHYWQMQMQMAVTGIRYCAYVQYGKNSRLHNTETGFFHDAMFIHLVKFNQEKWAWFIRNYAMPFSLRLQERMRDYTDPSTGRLMVERMKYGLDGKPQRRGAAMASSAAAAAAAPAPVRRKAAAAPPQRFVDAREQSKAYLKRQKEQREREEEQRRLRLFATYEDGPLHQSDESDPAKYIVSTPKDDAVAVVAGEEENQVEMVDVEPVPPAGRRAGSRRDLMMDEDDDAGMRLLMVDGTRGTLLDERYAEAKYGHQAFRFDDDDQPPPPPRSVARGRGGYPPRAGAMAAAAPRRGRGSGLGYEETVQLLGGGRGAVLSSQKGHEYDHPEFTFD